MKIFLGITGFAICAGYSLFFILTAVFALAQGRVKTDGMSVTYTYKDHKKKFLSIIVGYTISGLFLAGGALSILKRVLH